MKAIISVVGKDSIGIMSKVSSLCASFNASIVDVNQTIIDSYFAMIMIVETSLLSLPFSEFVDKMEELGKNSNLNIHVMHEDIFNMMHHI